MYDFLIKSNVDSFFRTPLSREKGLTPLPIGWGRDLRAREKINWSPTTLRHQQYYYGCVLHKMQRIFMFTTPRRVHKEN